MLLFNRYEYNPRTDLVGKGLMSRVYKAVDKETQQTVAVKLYRKTNADTPATEQPEPLQAKAVFDDVVLQKLHQQTLEKEDAFGEPEQYEVTVSTFANGGTARKYFQAHPTEMVLHQIVDTLITAIPRLHSSGIHPLNMKPSNVLIVANGADFAVKLSDIKCPENTIQTDIYSSAKLLEQYFYHPPESFGSIAVEVNYDTDIAADIWRLGVTLFEIITGQALFKDNDTVTLGDIKQAILHPIKEDKITLVPAIYQSLIENCLHIDPSKRSITVIKDEAPTTVISTPTDQKNDTNSTLIQPTLPPTDTDTTVLNTDQTAHPINEAITAFTAVNVVASEGEENTTVNPTTLNDRLTQVADDQNIPTTVLTNSVDSNFDGDGTTIINKGPVHRQRTDSPPERREGIITLFNRYEYLPTADFIGRGGFSRVYKAYDKRLSRWVALKVYKTNELSDRYSPFAEIKRVIDLDHSNICRYLDMEEMENVNSMGESEKIQVCVMELLDSGNIAEYYRKHPDPKILKKLLTDVLSGIAYLHKKGIIHRDIKPANILIKETIEGPVAKITDFGISKASDSINNNSSSALIVSIPFMAPEQFNTKKYGINEKISFNLDLWSLGVTIYEIYTGNVLFKENDQDNSEQIMANIMAPDLPEKINRLPQPFKTLVSRCLVKNARDRVQKAEELVALLNIENNEQKGTIISPDSLPTNGHKNPTQETTHTLVLPNNNDTKTIQHESITVKPKIKFSIDNDITTQVKKTEKKNKKLFILIPAAVLLTLYFLFFGKLMSDNSIKNQPPSTDSLLKKQAVTDTPVDSSKAPVAPTNIDSVVMENNRLSQQGAKEIEHKKDADTKAKNNKKDAPNSRKINSTNKLVLELSATQPCTVSSNGNIIGELNNGEMMKVYLPVGTHLLKAVAKEGNAVYEKVYSVFQRDLNTSSSLLLRLQ